MPRDEVSSRPRLEKLGVKPRARVLLVELPDAEFRRELRAGGAELAEDAQPPFDCIFVRVRQAAELSRLAALRPQLAPAGALWLIRPKGAGTPVREGEAMAAGHAAGLVDVKVVSFSPEESALKFVIPLALR